MPTMVYMSVRVSDNMVMAHFLYGSSAAEYSDAKGHLLVPFNLKNRERATPAAVGTIYKA